MNANKTNQYKYSQINMDECIILWGVIVILLIGNIFIIRFFRKNESSQKSPARRIEYLKQKIEELKIQIEQQNEKFASLLTENEQLREALRENAGYVIERNNKDIQSLKKEISRLQKALDSSLPPELNKLFDDKLW